MLPSSRTRLIWDSIQAIFLIIQTIVTPLDLAFHEIRQQSPKYSLFMYLVDVFFGIDILMTFFTAFENEHNEIVDDCRIVFVKYITGWFIIDFASIIPIDYIFQIINYQSSFKNVNRFFKVLRISRLFDLPNIHKI